MKGTKQQLKSIIMELVYRRGAGKTICPSEAARAFAKEDNWRRQMDTAREAASELRQENSIYIEQGGNPVELEQTSGPVRLRLREEADE
ncbi:MAG: DUF3253 domain-containing protein [Fodinibius sp.]|nr:DUF3253 domain-containing protein [Fodinibius sp.]